ncbi:MAG TPA: IclR family transcriptional regulator C-terminal domain-containing protein [Nakamurella sp.]
MGAAALRRTLADVRRDEVAVLRRNEPEPLVAVAAPIRGEQDEVVAGLSVEIPTGTIDPARVGPAIRAAARAISRGLGSPRSMAPPEPEVDG